MWGKKQRKRTFGGGWGRDLLLYSTNGLQKFIKKYLCVLGTKRKKLFLGMCRDSTTQEQKAKLPDKQRMCKVQQGNNAHGSGHSQNKGPQMRRGQPLLPFGMAPPAWPVGFYPIRKTQCKGYHELKHMLRDMKGRVLSRRARQVLVKDPSLF